MARDLAVFLQPLPVSPEPGLESADPRLLAVTGLAGAGKYPAAAEQIEVLVAEGVYDIRLLSIYLFAAFREAGPVVLADVLAVLENLLGDSFEAVGPTLKREGHFDKRVAWLCGEIVDALEYHDLKRTPEWEAWSAALSAEVIDATILRTNLVEEKLVTRGMGKVAGQGVARLRTWLHGHREAPVEAPHPAAEPAPAPASTTPGAPGSPGADGGGGRPHLQLAVTPRFLELCAKLRAFESLIEKKEFRKAALIADDVQQIVEHFDPRSYFPEVFAGFSARLSKNIGSLAEHWEERDSVAWKALSQFYQVDLDGFVESG